MEIRSLYDADQVRAASDEELGRLIAQCTEAARCQDLYHRDRVSAQNRRAQLLEEQRRRRETPAPTTDADVRELRFTYTNWRGDLAARRVRPVSIRFGHSAWHTEPQWLLFAEDLDKFELREFAMSDMRDVMPEHALPVLAKLERDR